MIEDEQTKVPQQKSKAIISDEGLGLKHKDLRQKEQKLRKWENELKLKESQLQMAAEEAKRREDYVNKVEARNRELEPSVRILNRRIVMLEENSHNSINTPINTEETIRKGEKTEKIDSTKDLLEELHNKVSNFIVRKIDKQLQLLEFDEGEERRVKENVSNNIQFSQPTTTLTLNSEQQIREVQPQQPVFPPTVHTQQQSTVRHSQQPVVIPTGGHTSYGTVPSIVYAQQHQVLGRPLYYSNPQSQHFLGQRPHTNRWR